MDYSKARETMVEQQIRPWDVLDVRVLEALVAIPREHFVDEPHKPLAYSDIELPIGHGERMLKPVMQGRILQSLALQAGDEVLEIGTGSGFLSACIGRLARDVVSLEHHADLAEAARDRLVTHATVNVRVEAADAFEWTTDRRFNAICVTGAVDTVPQHFVDWLKPGGRMFIVHGRSPSMDAVRVWRDAGGLRVESLFETELGYLRGAAPVPTFAF